MKRFFITLLLAGIGASTAATAQSSRTYDDDIYTSGSAARGEDEARRSNSSSTSSNSNYSASSQQRGYNADGYGDDGYGDDGYSSYNRSYDNDYVDYDDDDYYYATRLNRFGYSPFYNRGYWSAFNNPFWYDPFWYDPYWGYNPWYRPGFTISIGTGWGGFGGGPYWNSYWGYNTWYGYSGFNSCWGYPVYAGGWGGGYWNGFNQGYYNGYWNGYYAGLYNGGYGGYGNYYGYGNNGWRATSYGPRNTMNSGMRPGGRTAYNGGVAANNNAGVILGPRDGRRVAMDVGNTAKPTTVRDRAFSGDAARTPRSAGVATAPGTVPDRSGRVVSDRGASPSRYQTSPDRDDRFDGSRSSGTVTDRFGSTADRIRTDRAPARSEATPDRSVDAAPARTPRTFGNDRTAEAPRNRYNNVPAYEAPRNRSFGQSDNSFDTRAERNNNNRSFGGRDMNASPRMEQQPQRAPRFESAPRQESRSFERPAPRMERQRSFESAPAPRMESQPRMSTPQRSDFGGGSRGGSFGGGSSPAPRSSGGSFGGRR